MKSKYIRAICLLCAAVIMTAAFSIPASAGNSIADQMAANSAAWWVAFNAGDQETCDRLHAANVALAEQAANGGGSSTYNEAAGTWNVSTSEGNTIASSSSQDGKQTTSTYTTTTSSGGVSSSSTDSYSDSSINSYYDHGGTSTGLQNSYNNAATNVTTNDGYGSTNARNSAAGEAAVAKALLGLTNAEAQELQRELETSKQAYDRAKAAYESAVASGDTEAADQAKAQMDAAHTAAEETRQNYNYSGDKSTTSDGGYYYDDGSTPSGDGGGFFITDVTPTYVITATATGGGTISPSDEVKVKKGESVKFTMTPDQGARLLNVYIDGINYGARNTYTFTNVRAKHTIEAVFFKNYYEITASAGEGGKISPSGTNRIRRGTSYQYRIQANSGYEISRVLVDGVDVGVVTTYRFTNIVDDHTIQAEFKKNTFMISSSAGEGGTISPSGTRVVRKNANVVVRITPNTGWHIQDVIVDGQSAGAVSSYQFLSVTENHTISAKFERDSYGISASAGSGGSISPSGTVNVLYGRSQTFTMNPNSGYEIDYVMVDGVNMGGINRYTFTNVSGTHSIAVYFRVAGQVEVGTPVITDSNGISLEGSKIKSGYGIKVEAPVTATGVNNVQVTLTYDFGDGRKTVTMESSGGKYVLPVNSASPTGARVVYIPVGTQDGTYTLSVTVTAKRANGNDLSDTASDTVTVCGSMFEDDFTGDS